MKTNQIVYPSSQVDSVLPGYIVQNYQRFVEFMSEADRGSERIGFGQDILQNLQKYRNFDTYKNQIVQFGTLNANISATDDELELVDSYGFPDTDGVILIGDEVILYRRREGNTLTGLQRGAAGTTVLPTLRRSGVYVQTVAAGHKVGDNVTNLSVLFLVAMLDNIHVTFANDIDSQRVNPEINRSSLLQNIRDFFTSKGSKLGIQALFRMLFGQNDVDVNYPGDQMITPSKSTYVENVILRTIPFPRVLTDTTLPYITPDKMIGAKMYFKSANDPNIAADVIVDYASSYPFENEVQYEIHVDKENITGDLIINPTTTLTRTVISGGQDGLDDFSTITVESTLGFPESGVLYIDSEGIYYNGKTFNQFLNCQRGYESVTTQHEIGSNVFGPYYLEGNITLDGVTYTNKSWPLGLVESVAVTDPGVLHTLQDEVYVNGPGKTDNREPSLRTFLENVDDDLVTQKDTATVTDVGNYTQGVNSVYFNDKFVFIASSDLPGYQFGGFSTDGSVGPGLKGRNAVHVLNRYDFREDAIRGDKIGTDGVGIFVDGVPAWSPVSKEKLYQGSIHKITVTKEGRDYLNPTILVNGVANLVTPTIVNGRITDIISTSDISYVGNPPIRISSGENASLSLTFDIYGRVTGVSIDDGGQYYNDTPTLVVVDSSNRGRGALMSCQVSGGAISQVDISSTGIDYNPATTYVSILPIGQGCEAETEVQFYSFDRLYEINNTPTWNFDDGRGFLYEDEDNVKSHFAYIANPTKLRERLGDTTEAQHSPLLGWAYDGNPIYGPYGYSNGVDDTDGFKQQFSGYNLRANRENIPVGNIDITDEVLTTEGGLELMLDGEDVELATNINPLGTNPPSVEDYPLGSFIEDYIFDPENTVGALRRIKTDIYNQAQDRLLNQTQEELQLDGENDLLGFDTDTDFVTTDSTDTLATESGNSIGLTQNINVLGQDPNADSATLTDEILDIVRYDGGGEYIKTESQDYINAQTAAPAVLGDTNGKVCNTPEFPVELYPDGVFCYFISHFNETPKYPYIVGPSFYQRPLEQKVILVDAENEVEPTDPDGIVFNYMDDDRYRIPDLVTKLASTNDEVVLEIDNVSRGSISDIVVEDGSPNTTMVNDLLFFDNSNADGSGAEGKVTHIQGKGIVDISGTDIATKLISHHQRINLDNNSGTYVFTTGSRIETSGGSTAVVSSYDPLTKYLDVQVTSKRLIQFGETFYDNRETLVTIDSSEVGVLAFNDKVTGGSNTFISYNEPTQAEPGDLWWSSENGRLYIYFIDTDSAQWVSANPVGARTLAGSTSVLSGVTGTSTQEFQSPQADRKVTISTNAPDARTDGSANQKGDLWWSPHTGMLYIWYTDRVADYDQGSNDWTAEWVATDPNALPQTESQANVSGFRNLGDPDFINYTGDVTVLVSETSPLLKPDNSPMTPGTLWWSPISGKLYIYYTDSDSSHWVNTNPAGTLSGPTAVNSVVVGDGGEIPDALSILPEAPGQKTLWFESLNYFELGDNVRFEMGVPGNIEQMETVRIDEFINGSGAGVTRGIGDNNIELRDGALAINTSRALFNVTTTEPHGLSVGEIVRFDSDEPELDKDHEIIAVGKVKPATVTAVVAGGEVTGVTIDDPGANYINNFYCQFYGGGGVGAYAYATVASEKAGGGIVSITMVEGGVNYTSAPNVVLGDEPTDRQFTIFTTKNYGDQTGVTYSTTSLRAQGNVAIVGVSSPGIDYTTLPVAVGIYKKEIDRAKTKISLSGTQIGTIEVLGGGSRYVNPKAVITDTTGKGYGAEAVVTVVDGIVTDITVTNNGTDYVEPELDLVEQGGKYVAVTEDIGKIQSIKVLNPGRNITVDRTTKPELKIESRFVVSPTPESFGTFTPGQLVYQGTPGLYRAYGEVVSYELERQILTLKKIEGVIKENENIYNMTGTIALVRKEGQPDAHVVIAGKAGEVGRFIDDTSVVSASYANIQDSEYYQLFSYEIESSLQQVQYETFVKDIVHPTGFAMFASLRLNDSVVSGSKVEDVNIILEDGAGPPVPVLGLDTNGGILGLAGYTGISVLGKQPNS